MRGVITCFRTVLYQQMYGGVSSKGSTNYHLFFFLFSSSSSSSSFITIIIPFLFFFPVPTSQQSFKRSTHNPVSPLALFKGKLYESVTFHSTKKILLLIDRDLISCSYLHFNSSNLVHLLTLLSRISFPLLQFYHRSILHYDTKYSLIF